MKIKLFILLIVIICLSSITLASEIKSEKLPYNYNGTDCYVIRLSPIEAISTKKDMVEGQIVKFKVRDDVFINNKKFLSKDEIINAKVETVTLPGRAGIPAELTIDNFVIPETKKSQLISEYTKQGRYKWWFMVIKLTIPPPLSIIPIGKFIKGGHAKIKPKDIIEIKYFPAWK